ncbi:MAG TPA: hypothetical protein VJ901_01220 [Thermoanaerobaculia bacterium]|nr:hypothetical protein [Thermoanaerobaculia bacterium]
MNTQLFRVVSLLRDFYRNVRPGITDPFELILLENVAYLVET